MSPDKYPSILSYLQSFRRRLIQPLHRDLGQSPYHLWVIVINQVQKEYPIPVQMAMRRLVISNNSRFTFSHDDLIQQMNDLIEDVENVDVKWLKEQ